MTKTQLCPVCKLPAWNKDMPFIKGTKTCPLSRMYADDGTGTFKRLWPKEQNAN